MIPRLTAIYPNMAVDASIITTVKDNIVLVPNAAVQGSTLRVMKNGKLTSVDVTVGLSNDTQTEIVSGVSDGDTVVTGPPQQEKQLLPPLHLRLVRLAAADLEVDETHYSGFSLIQIYKTENIETSALDDISFTIKKGEFCRHYGSVWFRQIHAHAHFRRT